MLQTTYREVRVVDGVVIQNLSTSPSFFASTTILIIGGLLAVLGTTDKASELVREIPFAARTSVLVFDLKLLLLLAIFVYAFFRFTWSMRQYTFGALLVAAGARGEQSSTRGRTLSREAFADKAGRVVGMAAETFNDGLRAYYFAFAAIGWFFSPLAFMVADGGRRLHPLPARVPLRGARCVEREAYAVGRSRARRTPLNCHCASRREEVAVARADVPGRRGARAAAQHVLVAHELAVVFADQRPRQRPEAGIGRVVGRRPFPDVAEHLHRLVAARQRGRQRMERAAVGEIAARRRAQRSAPHAPIRLRSAGARRPSARTRRPRSS